MGNTMKRIVFASILLMLLAGCKSTGSSDSIQQVRRNFAKYNSTSSLKNNRQAFDLILLMQQGKTEEAIAGATRVLVKKPRAGWAYLVRGQAYLYSGQNELAIEDLSKAIELDPDNGESYFFRGIASGMGCRSHCKSALEDLTMAIGLGTERVNFFRDGKKSVINIRLQRSVEFEKDGQLPEALADLDHLINREPEIPAAYIRRSQVQIMMGNFGKAFQDARTYHALTNGSADGYNLMGSARYYQGNYAQAEKYWNNALETARRKDPNDKNIGAYLANLAVVNWAAGKPEQGLDWMTQAVRLQQNNPQPFWYIRYGSLLHEIGKRQEAAAAFARARGLYGNCLNLIKGLEPRYRHTPQLSRFFDHQMSIARYYLENNSGTSKRIVAKPVKAIKPSLSITSLKVIPSTVSAGQPFDIGIGYTIEAPTSWKKTELTFRFQILANGKVLFTSSPIAVPAKKGTNQWKQNMMPSKARGKYVVKVSLEGVGRKQSATKTFRIQ
jgi:tetratricopeptide (TPR) repeat protein